MKKCSIQILNVNASWKSPVGQYKLNQYGRYIGSIYFREKLVQQTIEASTYGIVKTKIK
jgi:hypothetical protein